MRREKCQFSIKFIFIKALTSLRSILNAYSTKALLQHHDPNIDFCADNAAIEKTFLRSQCHLKQVNISQYDAQKKRDIQFDSRFIDLTIQQ